ncbi:MAG: methyltransferase domain-containing protein [Chitinophagaceae bacterium]|nr:MAG: methyltransferase domain-containing protein [Chitinophagaceae bacterium]
MKNLICPLCASPLIQNSQGVSCINRHQFDCAKEGYFNLLPVQYKSSLEPGDAKQQLQARRAFLTQGFFAPLVTSLLDLIPKDVNTLLDIGCGEGYFTQHLGAHCKEADVYGIDISKAGIRLAAKNTSAKFIYAVASSYALPLADSSMDVITRIYAPSKDDELRRVICPGGKLLIVTPGSRHLIKLRQKIYEHIRPHTSPKTPEGFRTTEARELEFDLTISDPEHTRALLDMTPFSWRLSDAVKAELMEVGIQDCAHFQLNVYEIDDLN